MIHANLNDDNVCIGYASLKTIESNENLVYLPDGWDEDFLWRKYENGEWSAEKFEPEYTPQPDRIAELEAQLALVQAALDDLLLGGGA